MKCQKCDNKADLVTINLCQHCLSKVTYLPLNTGIPCPVCSKDIFQGNTLAMKNVDKINTYDSLAAKAELFNELVAANRLLRNHLGHYIRLFEDSFPNSVSLLAMGQAQGRIEDVLTKAKEL